MVVTHVIKMFLRAVVRSGHVIRWYFHVSHHPGAVRATCTYWRWGIRSTLGTTGQRRQRPLTDEYILYINMHHSRIHRDISTIPTDP